MTRTLWASHVSALVVEDSADPGLPCSLAPPYFAPRRHDMHRRMARGTPHASGSYFAGAWASRTGIDAEVAAIGQLITLKGIIPMCPLLLRAIQRRHPRRAAIHRYQRRARQMDARPLWVHIFDFLSNSRKNRTHHATCASSAIAIMPPCTRVIAVTAHCRNVRRAASESTASRFHLCLVVS